MSKSTKPDGLTYQDAGVDIEKANKLVSDIKSIASQTHRPGVIDDIGGFGAFFEIPSHYKNPLLVSGTDGVGTKLKLANALNRHDTIGIDLVAMCANDIICHGAEPLFFLDYYATGHLDLAQSKDILTGIARGCKLAGCALIGGETAEMPGMYQGKDYDLAGFCVGVVEKVKVIDGHSVQIGDTLIALASSGPHSNGYSLIRKVIEMTKASYDDAFEDKSLGEVLLTPTRIYAKPILTLLKQADVHGLANITGGGLLDNVPRFLPTGTQAMIDKNSWEWPTIFHWLQKEGNIAEAEMQRSFNLGVGMVICVSKQSADQALDLLNATDETAWVIGSVESSNDQSSRINFR